VSTDPNVHAALNAAAEHCDHYYETRILGGHPLQVRLCSFCRTPDWADLNEQAVTLRAAPEQERDRAYRERAHLVAHLASLYPSQIAYTDPDAYDWPVVTIETPAGQMSWHVAPDDIELFAHVERRNGLVLPWDGHTTEQKYERLRRLTTR